MSESSDRSIRTTQLTVLPIGESINSEMATTITIEDEGSGEFVVIEQHGRVDIGKIAIDVDEWPDLREAIDLMVSECRPDPVASGSSRSAGSDGQGGS